MWQYDSKLIVNLKDSSCEMLLFAGTRFDFYAILRISLKTYGKPKIAVFTLFSLNFADRNQILQARVSTITKHLLLFPRKNISVAEDAFKRRPQILVDCKVDDRVEHCRERQGKLRIEQQSWGERVVVAVQLFPCIILYETEYMFMLKEKTRVMGGEREREREREREGEDREKRSSE